MEIIPLGVSSLNQSSQDQKAEKEKLGFPFWRMILAYMDGS